MCSRDSNIYFNFILFYFILSQNQLVAATSSAVIMAIAFQTNGVVIGKTTAPMDPMSPLDCAVSITYSYSEMRLDSHFVAWIKQRACASGLIRSNATIRSSVYHAVGPVMAHQTVAMVLMNLIVVSKCLSYKFGVLTNPEDFHCHQEKEKWNELKKDIYWQWDS